MGILSSISSAIKSLASKVSGLLSGGNNQANVISATRPSSSNQSVSSTVSAQSTPTTIGVTKPGALNILNSYTAPNLGTNAPGIVPQVYPGSTGAGSNQNISTGSYGGYTPPVQIPTTIRAGGSPASTSTTQFMGTQEAAPTYSPESLSFSSSTLSSNPTTVNVPSAPSYTDTGLVNNAGLVSVLQEQFGYDPATNTFQALPTQETPAELAAQERKRWYEDIIGMAPEKESVLNSPEVLAAQEEVNRRRQEVANYTAQLNSIVAQQNADLLRLREVGSREGVTEAVYGGQQLTINREAAIRALPVQAQIAAAQGNLELAQDYLGQITALKQEQVDNYYNYRKTVYDTFKEYATNEQKIKLDAINKADDRAYEERTNNIQRQDAWAKEALATGQTSLVSKIHALNPVSPTFNNDLSRLTSQIVPKPATTTSNVQTDNERALMSQFRGEQIVKDYNDVLAQKGTVDLFIQNGVGGPADLALVYSFMKGLDPTSVVRESEYAAAAKSGNIFQGAFAKFNGYFKEKGGLLPTSVKKEFQNLVNQKLAVKQKQYDNLVSQYEGIAKRQNLNPENVVIDYASGGLDSGKSSGSDNPFAQVLGGPYSLDYMSSGMNIYSPTSGLFNIPTQ